MVKRIKIITPAPLAPSQDTESPPCQGHSHPKLLVALGEGSKSSADKIQPTAHRLSGYGQYSSVVPWPLNNDGQCCVKPRSV